MTTIQKIKINDEIKEIPPNTLPLHICPKDTIICSINNVLRDLNTPLSDSQSLTFHNFDTKEGKEVFWHSSAHVLGAAILRCFPSARLVVGPPTENGFFYDVDVERPFNENDVKEIEEAALKIIKEKIKFVKEFKGKEELMKFYEKNEYKRFFIERSLKKEKIEKKGAGAKIDDECANNEKKSQKNKNNQIEKDGKIDKKDSSDKSRNKNNLSCYALGDFLDFCNGPHIQGTSLIKAFKITKISSSYFLGNCENASLQRVYGIAFPSKKLFKEYLHLIEEGKKRNHKILGEKFDLFYFSDFSPGCAFFTEGTFIYNALMNFLRKEYRKRGFSEVITPNIFMTGLWERSGHLENYRDDMFVFNMRKTEWALKPMNCPGHCLLFKRTVRSFRELPLRIADFGVLHRNELSGTCSGLTRVRRFQQDDAHIFCTFEQIEEEVLANLEFMQKVYSILGFEFELAISTRPEKFLGEKKDWDIAEEKLKCALKKFGKKFGINPGDGAFYGPKIDVVLLDALKRKFQCATIQLDFQLPIRFDLTYKSENGFERPVMVHRALLGSLERFIGILIENYGMKMPFWLSPRQIAVVPISDKMYEYSKEIKNALIDFEVKIYANDLTFNKKIRNAEIDGYQIILIVGEKEKERKEVAFRNKKVMGIEEFKRRVEKGVKEYVKEIDVLLND